jgi:hypothetical protein
LKNFKTSPFARSEPGPVLAGMLPAGAQLPREGLKISALVS